MLVCVSMRFELIDGPYLGIIPDAGKTENLSQNERDAACYPYLGGWFCDRF